MSAKIDGAALGLFDRGSAEPRRHVQEIEVQRDAWRIVDAALARRAQARIAAYNATALRAGVGEGKAKTQFVAKPEKPERPEKPKGGKES